MNSRDTLACLFAEQIIFLGSDLVTLQLQQLGLIFTVQASGR